MVTVSVSTGGSSVISSNPYCVGWLAMMMARKNFRNIVFGFAGKVVAFVELPEVGIPGFLHCALHVAGTPVIAGHGEIPVA